MKFRRIAIATLALAGVAGAQQQPAAPQANPITAAFKGRILGAHRNIAQAFDSIPESKFNYKPTDKQLTIGYIAQHVAEDNYLFCNTFGAMKADISEKDKTTPDSVKATWPKEELVTKLKASFAFCAQALGQVTDASLPEAVTFTYGGQARNTTRINMVLGHALDLADHYSQLANYMRLNNMLPPSALPRPKPGAN
ncbi:MAG TPA: DinB family protein [Gemmatimonadaceae bacterium]|nr:DinB family protein [Gemmatimonadaceae bacterium]